MDCTCMAHSLYLDMCISSSFKSTFGHARLLNALEFSAESWIKCIAVLFSNEEMHWMNRRMFSQSQVIIYVRRQGIHWCSKVHRIYIVYLNCFYLKPLIVHFYFSMPLSIVFAFNKQTTSFSKFPQSNFSFAVCSFFYADFRLLGVHYSTIIYAHQTTITEFLR